MLNATCRGDGFGLDDVQRLEIMRYMKKQCHGELNVLFEYAECNLSQSSPTHMLLWFYCEYNKLHWKNVSEYRGKAP